MTERWTKIQARIWQAAIKSTGMPPAQDALDNLIECYVDVLAERDAALAEINRLKKNDYTEYYCVVCKSRMRERESYCDEAGVRYHMLCKVSAERDAALGLVESLRLCLITRRASEPKHSRKDHECAECLILSTIERKGAGGK